MASKIKQMAAKVLEGRPEVDMEAGRRSFMKSLTAGAATAAVAGAAGIAATPASAAASTVVTVLNFALNLEYLEAEFYLNAFTGSGLPANLIGDGAGPVIANKKNSFTSSIVGAYSQELATDETNHVAFLRSALVGLGVVPASRPTIDLVNSFNAAAQAANLGSSFDPSASDANFVLASYIFEDVGVTAYHGALTSLTGVYLDAASGIMATEAYHAGIIRTYLFANGFSSQTQAISFLRSTLDGSKGTPNQNNDHGVGTTSGPGITNGPTSTSIQPDRTVNQVLNIVYADTTMSQKPGGFFPKGINMPT